MPQESSQHMTGRKDGQVSVSGQRCKQGDGFPIERLVMSINKSHTRTEGAKKG